ncbi:hypothetical protein BH10BAC2_BH10BAC2_18770 [soil metagenome]
MSFWIMIILMLVAGIIGGIVNFLLPGNNPEPEKYIKPWHSCVILGIGATLLIPLFLEITQSKLMDDIRFDWKWAASKKSVTIENDTVKFFFMQDTISKKIKSDTVLLKKENVTATNTPGNAGKNYLLWTAYCLLAAAAGFRFINMLINNVVKDEQLKKVESEKKELKKDNEKRTRNSQISQQEEDKEIREKVIQKAIAERQGMNLIGVQNIDLPVLPVLPPVISNNDPQKGRFGGLSEKNERKLSAKVDASYIPNFYSVTLVVESTNSANPLTSDVIFYIHDSFNPSVFTYTAVEFIEGKAIENEILSYGAFTVGVITDNGKTMLELDLAEDKSFPKEFRER